MLPILTSEESRAYDEYLISKVGIPARVLMENAARGAVDAIEDWLDELGGKAVLIFCGKGNNGGDGLAVARLLDEKGIEVFVFIAGTARELSPEASAQLKILKAILPGENIIHYPLGDTHFLAHIQVGIIIDAVLGTGAAGPLKGRSKEAVMDLLSLQDHFEAKILALDVPTGLNSDTGAVETLENGIPVVVNADRTVAMGSLKQGFYLQGAPDLVGEVTAAALGAKNKVTGKKSVSLIEISDLKGILTARRMTSSKFDYGHVLSISGSYGMTGAAIMASGAALRTGCGMVSVALPESQRAIVASAMPEIMTFGLPEDENGNPLGKSFKKLSHLLGKANVVHCGSGWLPTEEGGELVLQLLEKVKKPIVLDGGALEGLSKNKRALRDRKAVTIVTPHLGEFAKMLDMKWQDVEKDTLGLARKFASKNNAILVLKGAPTIVAVPEGNIYVNSTGNPGMATAGAGDVLAGMISGIVAQGKDILQSVLCAVFLHGMAGDIAAKELSEESMTATDITHYLPQAISEIRM
ncbi:MAG: NAD(P)H-hydrate dehydratase [Bacteroidota bacterium]|nr:NAD(P)H-hydrate dehydratase [Bacteroidota bacterium]MDP4235060.1 NAD(P)H-hydrate dehydratase [Bacteroidota bacterium]